VRSYIRTLFFSGGNFRNRRSAMCKNWIVGNQIFWHRRCSSTFILRTRGWILTKRRCCVGIRLFLVFRFQSIWITCKLLKSSVAADSGQAC